MAVEQYALDIDRDTNTATIFMPGDRAFFGRLVLFGIDHEYDGEEAYIRVTARVTKAKTKTKGD